MSYIFREYDIRGVFPSDLDEKTVKNIGYYAGLEIKKKGDLVAVGYDCRIHSEQLFKWLISGLNETGLKVINLGLVATPTAYYGTYQKYGDVNIGSSIMITGSHNPPQDNGFKITIDNKPFFGKDIEELGRKIIDNPLEIQDNHKYIGSDINSKYIKFLEKEFSFLKGLNKRLIFDCGNGMGGPYIRDLVNRFNLNAKILFEEIDGTFPNHQPDPLVRENLRFIEEEFRKDDFDIGFAYDGDCDRFYVLIDGIIIKPDILAVIIAKHMDNPIVIGEVKCSDVMYDEISKIGKAVMYKVGHSNLKMKIKEINATFATELSGHMFFNDRYFGYDDGFYNTLRVLELVSKGVDFKKELELIPNVYSTEEITIKIREERKFDVIKDFIERAKSSFPIEIKDIKTVDGARIEFENGWGLVRASNTSPKITTRFEAKTSEDVKLYEKTTLDFLNELI